MKIALVVGIVLALMAPTADAQPAYRCVDAQGRLVLGQGDPPPGLKCSEEPGLRPAPPSQRSGVDWEQKAQESRAARDAQAREQYQRNLSAERRADAEKAAKDADQRQQGDLASAIASCSRGRAVTVAVDPSGTVAVTGRAKAVAAFDACLAASGARGNIRWTNPR